MICNIRKTNTLANYTLHARGEPEQLEDLTQSQIRVELSLLGSNRPFLFETIPGSRLRAFLTRSGQIKSFQYAASSPGVTKLRINSNLDPASPQWTFTLLAKAIPFDWNAAVAAGGHIAMQYHMGDSTSFYLDQQWVQGSVCFKLNNSSFAPR
jgi:hypothetical protein